MPDSIFLSSSMAEHSAVNRRVVSSSLTWGATSERVTLVPIFICNKNRSHAPQFLLTAKKPGSAPGQKTFARPAPRFFALRLPTTFSRVAPAAQGHEERPIRVFFVWLISKNRLLTLVNSRRLFNKFESYLGNHVGTSYARSDFYCNKNRSHAPQFLLTAKKPGSAPGQKTFARPRLVFLPFACLPLFRGLRLRRRGTKKSPHGLFCAAFYTSVHPFPC